MRFPFPPEERQRINKFDPHPFLGKSRKVVCVDIGLSSPRINQQNTWRAHCNGRLRIDNSLSSWELFQEDLHFKRMDSTQTKLDWGGSDEANIHLQPLYSWGAWATITPAILGNCHKFACCLFPLPAGHTTNKGKLLMLGSRRSWKLCSGSRPLCCGQKMISEVRFSMTWQSQQTRIGSFSQLCNLCRC